jgi:hypothetical protein
MLAAESLSRIALLHCTALVAVVAIFVLIGAALDVRRGRTTRNRPS